MGDFSHIIDMVLHGRFKLQILGERQFFYCSYNIGMLWKILIFIVQLIN